MVNGVEFVNEDLVTETGNAADFSPVDHFISQIKSEEEDRLHCVSLKRGILNVRE